MQPAPLRISRFVILVALAAGAASRPAAAQNQAASGSEAKAASAGRVDPETSPRPVARVARVGAAAGIVLDGRLDEAAWAGADSLGGFIQSTPRTGEPATEPTVVRVLLDDRFLYIGARCYDSEPEKITVNSLEQDFETHDSDTFGVALDTYADRRNSFMFLVNPKGALKDGQTFNDSRETNLAWEGVVKIRTEVDAGGWTVEMAIPWTTLRFDPRRKDQMWGANFLRRIRRRNEESYWAPLERRERVHTMSRAGTLTGLEGIPAGRNLTVKPFALARGVGSGSAAGSLGRSGFDGGADLKWGPTPDLTVDLTYRTDFAQVEVDEEQVNLTRFATFFPEKRDFFMENSGIFTFGDVDVNGARTGSSLNDFTLFHSRRIGLVGGQPIPIVGGGRLTGKLAGFDVGVLEMQTGAGASLPGENFGVARVRRNVLGGSDVGLMVITRQATGASSGPAFNRSYGADANLRLLRYLTVAGYGVATDRPGRDGASTAGRAMVNWRDRLWDVTGFHQRIGEDFDPGVGFVRRRGVAHSYGTVGLHPRPPIRHVQELNPYLELHYITDRRGLETRTARAGFGVDLQDGSALDLGYRTNVERIDEPFLVSARDSTFVAAGAYAFREASASIQTNSGLPLSGEIEYTVGGFYGGSKRTVQLNGIWRPSFHVELDLSLDRNAVRLPGRPRIDADVFGGRVKYAASTRLFASAFVQYNRAADEVVSNIRFNYVHAPLSDFFLVYSERRARGAGALDRRLTAKLTKLLAF